MSVNVSAAVCVRACVRACVRVCVCVHLCVLSGVLLSAEQSLARVQGLTHSNTRATKNCTLLLEV